MFSKILIANRGEVAVRVIRACKEMGIKTVAIYSDADVTALHAEMGDESYCIGGPLVKDSYLNMDAIVTLAKKVGAEAIHPGYGMLSENPEFALLCEENGIVLISPGSEVMRLMGQKEMAREIVKLGMYIGIGGVVTFKNARKSVEVVQDIPLERIVLETDCPYLSPVPFRGKRNHSGMIVYTAEKIAEIKNISVEEVLKATCENAKKVYNII